MAKKSNSSTPQDEKNAPTDQRPVLKHYKERVVTAAPACRKIWDRAEENQRFAEGGKAQWEEKAWDERVRQGRPTFSFPDIELAVRAISGREITARYEPSFAPRGSDDGPWVECLREAVRYLRQKAHCDNIESMAFRNMVIDNYSVIEWQQMYDVPEVRGRTVCSHRPIWEWIWDPKADEICLKDRMWDARGFQVTIDEFVMLFPGSREDAKDLITTSMGSWVTPESDAAYRHPWVTFAEKGQYIRKADNQIFLSRYTWKEREGAYTCDVSPGFAAHPLGFEGWARIAPMLGLPPSPLPPMQDQQVDQLRQALQQLAGQGQVDPMDAALAVPQMLKMDVDTFEGYQEEHAQAFGQEPDYVGPNEGNFQWVIQQATIAGEKIIRQQRLPFRNFPSIFLSGLPTRQYNEVRMHSVVDTMKDPQKFKNFVTSLLSNHLQRATKMGLIHTPGTFQDDSDLESRLAQPFFILQTRPGIQLDGSRYQFVDGAGFPSGYDKFLDLADAAAWRATGLNPNTLGNLQDPRRVSGTVFNALADAVMTVLSWEFNTLRTARQLEGELMLDFLKEYYEPDDIREMVGPSRQASVPDKSQWAERLRRDVVLSEVPTTSTAKEHAWDVMSRQGTLDNALKMGIAPPWLLPKMLPDGWIEEEDRQKWIRWLEQKEAAEQAQAQGQQQQQPGGGGQPPQQ